MIEGAGRDPTQISQATLVTTIATYVSPTHVTTTAPAVDTVSGATHHYHGTDDIAHLISAIAAIPVGGVLDLAGRVYISTNTLPEAP